MTIKSQTLISDTNVKLIELISTIYNVMLLAFYRAIDQSKTVFDLVNGFMDEYEDESGIDTGSSINESYNSTDDYYSPSTAEVDSYTKLLLHLDNNVTDFESTPKTVTNNSVTFSDTVKKFGTHSASFNGSSSYLSVPDSDDFSFGSDAFTIDFWVNFTSLTNPGFIGQYVDGSTYIGFYGDGSNLYFGSFGFGSNFYITCPWTPSTATWYHVALVRIDNGNSAASWRIFINGVSQTLTLGLGSWNVTLPNASATLSVGLAASQYFYGYMDEVHISKGIARWTSNFTPPIVPYPIAGDMTLFSNAQVAEAVPTSARIVLFEEDVDAITLNTDLKVYISRDNGTTYSQVTLENEGYYATSKNILVGVVNISAQPSGTNIKYKVETLNSKALKLHGTGVNWA